MLESTARNIRRVRRDRDLTQAQLARAARITQQHLSNIERGLIPSAVVLRRIAGVLGVTDDTLQSANDPLETRASGLTVEYGSVR